MWANFQPWCHSTYCSEIDVDHNGMVDQAEALGWLEEFDYFSQVSHPFGS